MSSSRVLNEPIHTSGSADATGRADLALSGRRQRVLVVDDQQAIRELIALYLEGEDFFVQEAGSGPEAMLRFTQSKWDLVITDRMMPEMSGDELAESIRRLDPKIPIILVSGFIGAGMGHFPFDAVIHKPFTRESLLEAIETVGKSATRRPGG